MRSVFVLIFSALVLAGCTTISDGESDEQVFCNYDVQVGSLALAGPTDETMLTCVRSLSDQRVELLYVSSHGGDVSTALSIAEVIAQWETHIFVERYCSSSCANYFLPVARRVTVQPNAMVLLHGSIDQANVARGPDAQSRARGQALADRQAEFAERYGILPGWLMIRYTADQRSIGDVASLAGGLLFAGPISGNSRYLMVDEGMMRSCLRNVEVDPFVETTADQIKRSWRYRRLAARQGIMVSRNMRCINAAQPS